MVDLGKSEVLSPSPHHAGNQGPDHLAPPAARACHRGQNRSRKQIGEELDLQGVATQSIASAPCRQGDLEMACEERFQTEIVTTPEAFLALKEDWNGLLRQTAWHPLFLTWEWQHTWWQARGGELFIVLVRDAGALVAILPFLIVRKFSIDLLRFIGTLDSDYLDFIVKCGYEEPIVDFFLNDFLNDHPRIGMAELECINERSSTVSYLMAGLPSARFDVSIEEKACTYIEVPASWDAYLARLSPKMRYYIRRKERKLHSDFKTTIAVVRDVGELDVRMGDFFTQHQQRWNRVGRPGAFFSDSFHRFHKIISRTLFELGILNLYYVELDDKPVGSYYMFRYDGVLHFYLSGFDPVYERYSLGVVLLAQTVKDAIDDGLNEVDLMREPYGYKLKWAPRKRLNRTFSLIRKKGPARGCFVLQRTTERIARGLKRLLPPRARFAIRRAMPKRIVSSLDRFFRE